MEQRTRWVNRLLPFKFEISHIPGKDMGFTDPDFHHSRLLPFFFHFIGFIFYFINYHSFLHSTGSIFLTNLL